MSYTSQQTTNQTLNGVISITDGTLTIENGTISNIQGIDVEGDAVFNADVHIVGDATIDGLLTVGQAQSSYTPVFNNDLVNKLYLDNYVDLTTVQTIGGTKTFSNQVTFSGVNKTNLVATDIPPAGSRAWLDSGFVQGINGAKNFGSTCTFNGTFTANGTTNLNNGVTCNNKNIINVLNPVNAQDVATKNYVDTADNLKANITYVDSQDALKADTSYVNSQDALKANITYVDSQDALKANITYVDSQDALKADTSYVNTQLGLKADTSYVNTQLGLKANITYVDSQDALKADTSYVNTQLGLKANISYVDSQDALKVSKSGDTMTDFLTLPEIRLQGKTTTYNSGTIDIDNRTNTYAVFDSAGAASDWAFLRQIGGSNDIHLAIDFHDDDLDGKFSLRNVVSTANPDSIKPFFTSSPSGTIINNPSTTTNINKQLELRVNNDTNNGLFFHTNLTPGSWNGLVGTNDKAIIFSDGSNGTGNLVIGNWGDGGIKIQGTDGKVGIGTGTPSEKLDVSGNIKCNNVIRNSWASGELIQTKIYNATTSGTGIANYAPNATPIWKSVDFTMKNNNVSDSILTVEVFAPYHISGDGVDKVLAWIRDFTSSTEQIFYFQSQYFDGNGGGGTRSGTILPMIGNYTPTLNTSNKTRTIQIRFNNNTNDTLYLCQYVDQLGNIQSVNYYTIRICEYAL